MTKFFEEFVLVSKGDFPMLKLCSATYLKDKRELTIKFIISAFEVRLFNDDSKNKVKKIVDGMFSGVNVVVQYIRTYADVNVVKNKIMEYFNKHNQMIFRRVKDESIELNISDKEIDIKLFFETPTYKMIVAGNMAEELKAFLDTCFNQDIDIVLEEKVVNLKDFDEAQEPLINTVVMRDSSLRLVDIRTGEKLYTRGKIGGISQLPNYIFDVKGAADNIVLCGKVSNISKKMYKNKKYNPDDKKGGEAELPLVRFILDDTTAKIECVCFPRAEEADKLEQMAEYIQLVCIGKVGVSAYNNALSYSINGIFECEIDFSSIHLTSAKPVPDRYETVLPEAYNITTQNSLFDDENIASDEYFAGKTFVVYDLEATDKTPDTAEIIEIAAIKIVNGRPTQTFQTLVKPTQLIPAKITEITSIDNAMVENSPSIESVLPDFFKFSRNCILVGHNISGYDYPLIAKYAEKAGFNFDNDLIDTLLLARKHLKEMKSFSLENLSKSYGISHENAHRAMSDVLATIEILKILAKRM